MAESPEYHSAHLAFARAEIIATAAAGQPLFDRLHVYTADVVRSVEDTDEVVATEAAKVVEAWDQWLDYLGRIEYQVRGHAPFAQAMEDLRAAIEGRSTT